MSAHIDRVAGYYSSIDCQDVDAALALFAENAFYRRADIEYRNRDEIERFFRRGRRIRGQHVIQNLWSDEDRRIVFVTGRFAGHGEEGDERKVGFADVWQFGREGLVTQRSTYLALGHAYIER